MADVYENPRLGTLADTLDEFSPAVSPVHRTVVPTPRRARVVQELAQLPLATLVGLRWLVWLAAANNALGRTGAVSWAPTVSWWWVLWGVGRVDGVSRSHQLKASLPPGIPGGKSGTRVSGSHTLASVDVGF